MLMASTRFSTWLNNSGSCGLSPPPRPSQRSDNYGVRSHEYTPHPPALLAPTMSMTMTHAVHSLPTTTCVYTSAPPPPPGAPLSIPTYPVLALLPVPKKTSRRRSPPKPTQVGRLKRKKQKGWVPWCSTQAPRTMILVGRSTMQSVSCFGFPLAVEAGGRGGGRLQDR